MALYEFKLPDIGEGVTEGEIVEWHVAPGQSVREDDPMVEVMTDKATVTIGAPKDGTIQETRFGVGDIAPVGDVLVVLDVGGADNTDDTAPADAPSGPAGEGGRETPAAAGPSTSAGAVTTPTGTATGAEHPPGEPPAAPARPAPVAGSGATAVGDLQDRLPGTELPGPPSVERGAQAGPSQGAQRVNGQVGNGPGSRTPGSNGSGQGTFVEKPLATPATRKLARDLDVDLRTVPPTGDGGRVTKEDVERAAYAGGRLARQDDGPAASGPAASPPSGAAAPASPSSGPDGQAKAPGQAPGTAATRAPVVITPPKGDAAALEDRKPFVGIRRKIAERMQTAKNTAAHFTFVEECHVDRLVALRKRMKPVAAEQGATLTFLPFIVKAVVAALRKFPVLNSALDESTNELVYRRYYDVGIAAQTDQGLMVPVLRGADRLSLVEIAKELARLGEGARNGTLSPGELSGSTFTITSLGKTGGLFATPVLNFPEVGILGIHQIKERPVVRDGAIEVGQVMLLSLSFDHRIVDGAVGAEFAYEIIGLLEDPDRLFLEMS
ncbi:MAG TPA: dihydrolipoamide acetyltransferase family protein [Polyangiaceae bacterium LLY-WYZ-14_1]|nr:dihydrolipoamide acetyltransferase family protein [Polyangiaceae bacterium LLY-WYZ-14_1]